MSHEQLINKIHDNHLQAVELLSEVSNDLRNLYEGSRARLKPEEIEHFEQLQKGIEHHFVQIDIVISKFKSISSEKLAT